MGKFYDHLRSGEPVGPALRHAQLWLRSATAGDLLSYIQSLLKEYPRLSLSEWRQRRALLRLRRGLRSIDAAETPYQHPYYWAAFYALDLESLNEEAKPTGD
jgi:CHAT domain-containing protein